MPIDCRSSCLKNRMPKARRLAAEILYHLPRELRNRIYTFCVQGSYDNEVIVRRAADSKGALALLTRQCSGQHSYRWVEDPTPSIVSAQHLGRKVAQEMLEAYYWTRTFKFTHRDLSIVTLFLATDQFGFGMTPHCYARRLHIQFQPGVLALPEEKRCLQGIEHLGAMLTTRTEVAIDIEVPERQDDFDHLQTYEPAEEWSLRVAQAVYGLREQGLRVEMLYRRTWTG